MRQTKVYEPEERRQIQKNLFCHYCGNTNQWQMDMRLRHVIESSSNGFIVCVDDVQAKKIQKAIEERIWYMLSRSCDRAKPIFHCANCGNSELDTHENVLDTCYNLGCPGCFHCGNWIDEDDLRETCISCIQEEGDNVHEEFCFYQCPHYDYGLEEVRQHYNISLDELIEEAGWV